VGGGGASERMWLRPSTGLLVWGIAAGVLLCLALAATAADAHTGSLGEAEFAGIAGHEERMQRQANTPPHPTRPSSSSSSQGSAKLALKKGGSAAPKKTTKPKQKVRHVGC
jgi:hypothetical protein